MKVLYTNETEYVQGNLKKEKVNTSLRRGVFVYTHESISVYKILIKRLYWMVDYCTF